MYQAIQWEEVRYRGDAQDVKELTDVYRVDHYLKTYEENQRQLDNGARDELLRNGIRLSEHLSPRIFKICKGVSEFLKLKIEAEIFCIPDQEINAMAVLDLDKNGENHSIVGVTSAALERLEDDELASILGHEFGHFLFHHHHLNALINQSVDSPVATVLPPLGESLFLRWRKKSEVSADRVGLLACGDVHAAARALLKATFGLTNRNLNLDIDALLSQIDELKGKPELIDAAFASHPLLPIRLKALDYFARSSKASRNGFGIESGVPLDDNHLEDAIDKLMRLTTRHPYRPISVAVMKCVALGGIQVLSADGDINSYETKVLIEVLHKYFTDEPEKEILTDLNEVDKGLSGALLQVNKLGDYNDKTFIISRLADVALADGALMSEEGAVVIQIAERLKLSSRVAYEILVGAAETVGFQVDVKLNRVADELREALRVGFNCTKK